MTEKPKDVDKPPERRDEDDADKPDSIPDDIFEYFTKGNENDSPTSDAEAPAP